MMASGRAGPDSRSIDTASWITLRWTRGTRYFRVHLEQDLWHRWLLTQVNGRSGSRLGPPCNARGVDRGRIVPTGRRRQTPSAARLPPHELEWQFKGDPAWNR